jgi:hypothetical protein
VFTTCTSSYGRMSNIFSRTLQRRSESLRRHLFARYCRFARPVCGQAGLLRVFGSTSFQVGPQFSALLLFRTGFGLDELVGYLIFRFVITCAQTPRDCDIGIHWIHICIWCIALQSSATSAISDGGVKSSSSYCITSSSSYNLRARPN